MEARPLQRERLDGGQVRGLFHDDAVAFVQEHLAQQIQDLLRTGGDEHVISRVVRVETLVDACGDPLAQLLDPRGGRVLECIRAPFGHHALHGFQQLLLRE